MGTSGLNEEPPLKAAALTSNTDVPERYGGRLLEIHSLANRLPLGDLEGNVCT